MFLAGIGSKNGADSYFMYTLIRNEREREKEDARIAKMRVPESEIFKLELDSKNATELRIRETKKELLKRNGCSSFKEFLDYSNIKTREDWEKFAMCTRFQVFNDEYKSLHPEQYIKS